MSEAVTKTVTGRCTEISEARGWTAFSIEVDGWEHPIKLSTKLQPLIELGRAASKDEGVFEWTYKESQGKENPHRPGTFYMDRYLSGVESVGEAEAAAASSDVSEPSARTARVSSPQDGMTPEKWDAKERRDYRSRAWAQTISAFQHTIKLEEDPKDVFLRLQPFQRKVYEDICGMFAYPADESDVPF